MADDKSNIGNAHRHRIKVEECYEGRYWAEKHGATLERLREAGKTFGQWSKT